MKKIGITVQVTKKGVFTSSLIAVIVFQLLNSQSVRAEFLTDGNIEASAISFPLGGSLDLEFGQSWIFWGEKQTVWSGFVRGTLNSSHAGYYNSGGGALEIFPVGFLGVRGGYQVLNNENEYKSFDCIRYNCEATWEKKFVEAQMALKWKQFFLLATGTLAEFDADSRNDLAVIEPTLALPMTGKKDKLESLTTVLGLELSSEWQALVVVQNYLFVDQDLSSQYQFLVTRWKSGRWGAQIGAGAVRSDLFPLHGSVIGGVSWEITPSPKLF